MYRSHTAVLTASWGRKISALLVLFAIVFTGLIQPAAAAQESRVLPQLKREAAAHPGKTFRVIVTRVHRDTKADTALTTKGGRKVKNLQSVDSFVGELTGSQIIALGSDSSVKFVNYDAPVRKLAIVESSKLTTLYPKVVNATGLWSSTTGAGVAVAVLDTGISKSCDTSGRIATKVVFNSALTATDDGNGHGTHVGGIIAGNSWQCDSSAIAGKYVGIAPEAKLINVRVSDENGMSYVSDVVEAIEWVVANRRAYNIRVMNLSLVSSVAESYKTSALSAAVERAWFSGILVVVAAGNDGANTMQYPPANDPFVITVGASDPMNTVAQGDDTIAPWSSYGTTQDGFSKPDVVAPGRYMVAPRASATAKLVLQDPTRIVDGTYLRLSGTSMAAPVVSGIAALAFQKHPEWTNDQVKWLLLNTATRLPVDRGQGHGEVNAMSVVNFSATPSRANQGLRANEQLIGPNGATVYTNDSTASWSTASWSTASWSTASWSTASWSTANTGTVNFSSADEKTVD